MLVNVGYGDVLRLTCGYDFLCVGTSWSLANKLRTICGLDDRPRRHERAGQPCPALAATRSSAQARVTHFYASRSHDQCKLDEAQALILSCVLARPLVEELE